VAAGRADVGRLRRALAGLPLPAWGDGRIRLAVDVCSWLRPDAATSPGRMHCYVRGRGKVAWVSPGWPYSFVAALSPGRTSWAMLLDAVRLGPGDDERAVTAAQLREVVGRLIAAGHWKDGDPAILIAMDAGYSPVQLAWLLRDLPVTIVARVRSDRVFYPPAPPKAPGTRGRPGRHGPPVRCGDPQSWASPGVDAEVSSARHGQARVLAWPRMHQALHRGSGGWDDWPASREFPLIEGTLIRLAAARPAPGQLGHSLALREKIGDPRRIPSALGALGEAEMAAGNLQRAVELLRRALVLARQADLQPWRIQDAEQNLRKAEAALSAANLVP
jgi:hypothetical protein